MTGTTMHLSHERLCPTTGGPCRCPDDLRGCELESEVRDSARSSRWRRLCCVCLEDMGPAPSGSHGHTHTWCPRCAAEVLSEAKAVVLSRREARQAEAARGEVA